MPDLSRKSVRDRLPMRRDPYWQQIGEGAYLGYRRGSDTWRARFRDRNGKQHFQPLGAHLEYVDAKRLAEEWLETIGGNAARTVKRGTVRAALEAYISDLHRHGRHGAAVEARWRFSATLYRDPKNPSPEDDPLADQDLGTATRDDFLEWRDRLTEGRAPRTVNRYVRAVAAGLNTSLELGHVGNPAAWNLTALADDAEDEGTAVFLAPEQRAGIIRSASTNAAAFFRSLEITGGRPGEMAAAKAGDFDGTTLRLAHRKGKPPKLRARYVTLDREGIAFFSRHTRGKLPGAPIFTEDGVQPWRRHTWAKAFREAVTEHNKKARGKARVPDGVGAYAFRHARISELLQVHEIDPLTVAQQTGTSLAMIEKAYFRFIPSAMRKKLEGLRGSA